MFLSGVLTACIRVTCVPVKVGDTEYVISSSCSWTECVSTHHSLMCYVQIL